jgi:hypothetical protein
VSCSSAAARPAEQFDVVRVWFQSVLPQTATTTAQQRTTLKRERLKVGDEEMEGRGRSAVSCSSSARPANTSSWIFRASIPQMVEPGASRECRVAKPCMTHMEPKKESSALSRDRATLKQKNCKCAKRQGQCTDRVATTTALQSTDTFLRQKYISLMPKAGWEPCKQW